MKSAVQTTNAPEAIGPYSQAIAHGGLLYCSGQVAIDPASGKLIEGDVEEQTNQVLINLKHVIEAAGGNMQNVLKTTVFLADMEDFSKVNGVYSGVFQKPYPARCAFAVKTLPLNALVEIDAIVAIKTV